MEEHLLGEITVSGAECLECVAFMQGKVENATHQLDYVRLAAAHYLYYFQLGAAHHLDYVLLDDAVKNFMTSLPKPFNALMSYEIQNFYLWEKVVIGTLSDLVNCVSR